MQRERERLRGERMKHFPHKFNLQHAHTHKHTRKRKREREEDQRSAHRARERMFAPSFLSRDDCDEKDEDCFCS
jgi:hypothetical protein